jgi:hypothetical protein
MIPVSDAVKTKVDVAVGGSSILGYFKAIPWPEIAAFLACVYTVLRIVEVVRDWKKKKK